MTATPASTADPAQTDETGSTEPTPGDPAPDRRDTSFLRGFRALRSPGFRIYFVGMLLRGSAMWMPLVAIPWAAVGLGATPTQIGIITGFFFLPSLVVGPLGGVLADRVDRRNVLVGAQLFAAALSTLVVLLMVTASQTLALLAIASFGFGLLVSVEVPVRQAFMTELVPRSDISSAASLHATAFNMTRLMGPVLAGIMIAIIGPAAPFAYSIVASLLVCVALVWMSRYREPGRQRVDRSNSVLSDLRAGTAFVLREPAVRLSMVAISAAAIFGMSTFMTLAPIYVQDELRLGADGFGFFLGASGAGGLTAALLVTTLAHGDRRRWVIGGLLAMSLILASIALATNPSVVFVLAFFLGFFQIVLGQNALVSVHAATPDHLRGRVMGLWVMNFQVSNLFGAVLAGWMADALGVRTAMLAEAAALAFVGLIAAAAIRRARWRLTPAAAASG